MDGGGGRCICNAVFGVAREMQIGGFVVFETGDGFVGAAIFEGSGWIMALLWSQGILFC